jgi:hypothetical protein
MTDKKNLVWIQIRGDNETEVIRAKIMLNDEALLEISTISLRVAGSNKGFYYQWVEWCKKVAGEMVKTAMKDITGEIPMDEQIAWTTLDPRKGS